VRSEDLGRSVALVGARLRSDGEGERVLLDGCDDASRPLVEGLLLVCELALSQMAKRDGVTRAHAADTTAALLRQMLTDGQRR
jgi:hypothetical protein